MSDVPSTVHTIARGAPTTVLVVEDEVLLRLLLAEELRMAGYTVLEAANGEEALTILRSPLKLDVVVTDLRMPHMDGAALVRAIRSELPYLKIIVVSGHLPAPDVHQQLDGYFGKPADSSLITQHIRTLCPGERSGSMSLHRDGRPG